MNTALAYSYIRFSTPEQAKGDSLRRQTELLDKWLRGNQRQARYHLDPAQRGGERLHRRASGNPDRHGLACFLEAIRSNRVKRGNYLIVENLDRLSREDVVPAVNLFTGILIAGVRIVQLTPHTQVYNAKADMMDLMRTIMELSRGNGESKRKSGMLSKAWEEKRRRAREDKVPTTNRLPGWIENRGGKLVLHQQHAKTVRRIYQLSLDGYGVKQHRQGTQQRAHPHVHGTQPDVGHIDPVRHPHQQGRLRGVPTTHGQRHGREAHRRRGAGAGILSGGNQRRPVLAGTGGTPETLPGRRTDRQTRQRVPGTVGQCAQQ